MRQKYEVRFAKGDPETSPTMDEQIALARVAARKLGIPNSESKPLIESAGTRTPARSGRTWSGRGRGCGKAAADQYEAICKFFGWRDARRALH